MQPESRGGSFIEDVGTNRRKRIFERTKWSVRAPVLGRQANFTKAVAVSGRSVPKRQAGLPVSQVTSAETNMDVSFEEMVSVTVEEDVVQVAEELKRGSLPAPVLPSTAEVEAHNVSHLPFRSWRSATVRGRGLSLGHRKVDRKTKEAEQIPTVSVDSGFFGQPVD